MKNIMALSLLTLATITGLLVNTQSAEAHRRYYRHYPYYRHSSYYCYPITKWIVDEDPAYHPQAYADGYRQGQAQAQRGNAYRPRTAGGEFSRGFDDGYYGREFAGQKHIVPNVVKPYTTTQCG
ncbi:hypothetical protein ACX27_19295 [Nostoc piscinale CENA21]|uniref:Uncharacterized protein n=1 Tax=Nostoc piscinale CENA21 TaxID=224013 RepID=A0A0M3V5U1_9NOSO|nr:hypothetical protein [Nostoc piscinale]ALF54503.1 hypothetical protein ACX27_19295 [Nostoc piscinale CENA21]